MGKRILLSEEQFKKYIKSKLINENFADNAVAKQKQRESEEAAKQKRKKKEMADFNTLMTQIRKAYKDGNLGNVMVSDAKLHYFEGSAPDGDFDTTEKPFNEWWNSHNDLPGSFKLTMQWIRSKAHKVITDKSQVQSKSKRKDIDRFVRTPEAGEDENTEQRLVNQAEHSAKTCNNKEIRDKKRQRTEQEIKDREFRLAIENHFINNCNGTPIDPNDRLFNIIQSFCSSKHIICAPDGTIVIPIKRMKGTSGMNLEFGPFMKQVAEDNPDRSRWLELWSRYKTNLQLPKIEYENFGKGCTGNVILSKYLPEGRAIGQIMTRPRV